MELTRSLPDWFDPDCVQGPLQWAFFLAPYILLTTNWWVLELPLLFVNNPFEPQASGIKPRLLRFWRAVFWNCVRVLQPSYVALAAMARTRDRRAWKVLYYFGHEPRDDGSRALTAWEWCKVAAMDGLPFAVEIWLVVQTCFLSKDRRVTFGLGFWLLHTVPAFVNGVWLVSAAYIFGRLNNTQLNAVSISLLVIVGLGLILASHFTSPNALPMGGWILTITYLSSMLPLCWMRCCGASLHMVYYLYSALCRGMPLVTEMVGGGGGAVLCFLDNRPPFLIPFIILGGVLVFLFATFGGSHAVERYRPEMTRAGSSEPQEDQVPLQGVASEQTIVVDFGTRRPSGEQGSVQSTEQTLGEAEGDPPPPYKRQATVTPAYEEQVPLREDAEADRSVGRAV